MLTPVSTIIQFFELQESKMLIFHNNSPLRVKKKSYPYFLHNSFQNPIVSKWTLSIDQMIECFVGIVAVMVDIFRFGPKRKLVDAPLANEEHLNHRAIHVAVI